MKHVVHISQRAVQDIEDLVRYISEDLKNPDAAERTWRGIMDTLRLLEEFPLLGATLKDGDVELMPYRFVQYRNFKAVYHLDGEDAYVDRVLYNRREYVSLFTPSHVLHEDVTEYK